MKEAIEKTWELLGITVERISQKEPGVSLNRDLKTKFDQNFRDMYDDIKDHYMESDVENLDRHKMASIIIVNILKTEVIQYNGEVKAGKKFFGQYLIAASVGITFMQNQLNKLLIEKNRNPIQKLWFPDALSCDTPYFEIFCRNLYFSQDNKEWGLNPLDIAERLFLLEYVTLEKCGIDPQILKVTKSDK